MTEFWSEKCREYRATLIDGTINATIEDFDYQIAQTSDPEVYNVVIALKKCIIDILEELKKKTQNGLIVPDVPLRLSHCDQPIEVPSIQNSDDKWRVGFLAITGNPIHWGHIWAALFLSAKFNLNTVILQVIGDHPYKRSQKQSKEHRHTIARIATEYFYPLIRYTPLGYNNLRLGEENAAEFLLLNCDIPLDLYYLAGYDASATICFKLIKACNNILSVVNDIEGTDLMIKLLLIGRGSDAANVSESIPDWAIFCEQEDTALPTFRNISISSALFRQYPHVPIIPSKALAYIKKNSLYNF